MFLKGAKAMLPILTGIFPFGLVMGSVSANAQLDFTQTVLMNIWIYAGASQLAAIDLLLNDAQLYIVIFTAIIINTRLFLYSAAFSPYLKKSNFFTEALAAYCLTDQSFTVFKGHEEKLRSNSEKIQFFIGASLCMILCWQLSVMGGFVFGNLAPVEWSLDFAIPISFACLIIPTLKGRVYLLVALCSASMSVAFVDLPYNLGLLLSAVLSLFVGAWLSGALKNQRVKI